MERKTSELIQIAVFLVIAIGNIFLASRYYPRGDLVGTAIFSIVVVLALVAAVGHIIEWKKL